MRIERIELRNFRNYENFTLDFTQPRTLLIGENGVGKSTVIDAILWGLIGRCRGVDGKGSGQKDLIRTGAEDMQVTVVTDTLGPVIRSVSRTGSAQGSMKPDMVLGRLDTTEAMLTACVYGQHFFGMDHAAGKELLLKLLDVKIAPADLPGMDLKRPVGLDELGAYYDAAFINRANLKKQLASVHVPDAPKVVQIDTAGKTVDTLKAELQDLQDQQARAIRAQADADNAVTACGRSIAAAEAAAQKVEQLRGAVTAHESMLAEHRQHQVAALQAVEGADALPAEPVASLQVQVSEAAVLIDKISRHAADTADTTKPKGSRKKVLQVVETPHSCVLSSGIPCLTPASEFGAALDGLKATQKSLEDRIRAGNAKAQAQAAAQQQLKEADRNVAYHEKQITEGQAKVQAAEAAILELDTLKAKLPDLQLAASRAESAAAVLKGDVQKLLDQITGLVEFQRAKDAHQAGVQRVADMTRQVTDADALVTLLGPKGIRLQALAAAVGEFESAINTALTPFGFQLAFQIDPWQVRVKTPDTTDPLPFELLSQGQKLWTGLAFQAGLAVLSGLEFFAVDDVEKVVGKNLALVTEQVMTLPVPQIIVAMAKADGGDAPELDGLQVVRLAAEAVAAG